MKGHNGIDYKTPHGSLVLAPCDMEIVDTYYENKDKGYGTTLWGYSNSWVEDSYEWKLEMVFGHLHEFIEKKGTKVMMGQPIAYTDNTGKYTTGAHLHFGVRLMRKTGGTWKVYNSNNGYLGHVDPKPYILDSFQDQPIRLFRNPRTKAVYWLGKNGQFLEIIDEVVIHQMVGDWGTVKLTDLKVDLRPENIYDVLANLRRFKQIYKVK